MRPEGTPEQLTRRRLGAVRQVVGAGRTQAGVAREAGVHPNTLCNWVKLFRAGGAAALAVKSPPGLGKRQVADVVRQVLRGARACGFDTDLWTLPRIAKLIERRHGVRYDADHLSRLARAWGLSWQKPALRPLERDEAAVGRWLARDWPRVKKKSPG
jgi:transposase